MQPYMPFNVWVHFLTSQLIKWLMAELTEREKKIVCIKFIMHNDGPFKKLPMSVRETMLASAVKLLGYDYDDKEMLDLGQAVVDLQHEINQSGAKFLDTNKDIIKEALKHMTIDKFKKLTG